METDWSGLGLAYQRVPAEMQLLTRKANKIVCVSGYLFALDAKLGHIMITFVPNREAMLPTFLLESRAME